MVGEGFLAKKILKSGKARIFVEKTIGVTYEDFELEMEGILDQWEYELMLARRNIF